MSQKRNKVPGPTEIQLFNTGIFEKRFFEKKYQLSSSRNPEDILDDIKNTWKLELKTMHDLSSTVSGKRFSVRMQTSRHVKMELIGIVNATESGSSIQIRLQPTPESTFLILGELSVIGFFAIISICLLGITHIVTISLLSSIPILIIMLQDNFRRGHELVRLFKEVAISKDR